MTQTAANVSDFDVLPPHSIEAEQCFLGSLLRCMPDDPIIAESRSLVRREHFYQQDHQIIFDAICRLIDSGKPIELVLLREELSKKNLLEEIGGAIYIADVWNTIPTGALAVHYAKIIREKAIGRALITVGHDVIRKVYAGNCEFLELAKQLERQAARIAVAGAVTDSVHIYDAHQELCDEKNNPSIVRRIRTGLGDIDALIGGLPRGGFTLIGANGGMGKSQLGKQFVLNVAERGTPCGIISVEENRRKIVTNVLANLTDIENRHLTNDQWTKDDWQRVANATAKLNKLPIRISDTDERLSDIENQAARMVLKHKVEMMIIDHLHLIDAGNDDSRERQVSLISKTLKSLAKRLDIALVVLCQLNRGGGADVNRRPILRDLRDSGSLEADGDLILMLYREDYFRYADPGYALNHKLEALIRKNKDGPMGEVPLYFDGDHQRISNWNDGYGDLSLL